MNNEKSSVLAAAAAKTHGLGTANTVCQGGEGGSGAGYDAEGGVTRGGMLFR